MRRLFLLPLVLWFTGPALRAQGIITHRVTSGYAWNVQARHPFTVRFNQAPSGPDTPKPRQRWHGLDGSARPEFLCTELAIVLDGKSVRVPPAAYTDLGNVNLVGEPDDAENGQWKIVLEGGTAGGSYRVELRFDGKRLLERRFVDLFPTVPGIRHANEVEKF